ncbi:MAG: DUF4465 domain-containing protein [Bacteroidota bacterium]
MKKTKTLKQAMLALALLLSGSAFSQATFDDLTLPADTFWNGSDMTGHFVSGGITFENSYTDYGGGIYAWFGFAYSNQTDTTTAGLGSQFCAFKGQGALASSNYCVSSFTYDYMGAYDIIPNYIAFPAKATVTGFYANNSTYAGISIRDGDVYCKKFGGTSGNDPDWFRLSVTGYNNGLITDTVDFYLADFRFANNSLDYIIKDWTWVNLISLGIIDSIGMTLLSTDIGSYGMNTPAYFCFDNLTIQCLTAQSNNAENKSLNVYPNPSHDFITLNVPVNASLKVFNVTGELIYSKKCEASNEMRIDVSSFNPGVYTISLISDKEIRTSKFIKQ